MSKARFFTFRQNNSGGQFVRTDNLDCYTIVEAHSTAEARERAEAIGVYFDGCESGQDCSCCGDRWSDYLSDDDGKAKPSGYDTPVLLAKTRDPERDDAVIHYLNGEVRYGRVPSDFPSLALRDEVQGSARITVKKQTKAQVDAKIARMLKKAEKAIKAAR